MKSPWFAIIWFAVWGLFQAYQEFHSCSCSANFSSHRM